MGQQLTQQHLLAWHCVRSRIGSRGRRGTLPEGHSSGMPSAEIGANSWVRSPQAGAPKTEGEALQILAAIVPLFTQHAGPSTQPKTSARPALVIMMGSLCRCCWPAEARDVRRLVRR
jgi:hypothetical protein